MDPTRDLLKRSIEIAEDVIREHYGRETVADRLLVMQAATIAADLLLHLGEARLREAVRGPLSRRLAEDTRALIRDAGTHDVDEFLKRGGY